MHLRALRTLQRAVIVGGTLCGGSVLQPAHAQSAESAAPAGPSEAASAPAAPEAPSTTSEIPPSKFDTFVAELDVRQETLSSQLESYARNIDRFFGDDRAFEDTNETTGQISVGMYPREAEGARFDFRLRVKIDLPRTKKRARLLIESDPKELGSETTTAAKPVDAAQQATYGIAIETQLKNTDVWKVSPATGIKVSSWPPDPYVRIRAIAYEQHAYWLVRYSAQASHFVVKGPQANASLDFDRSWVQDKLFRISTDLQWHKDFEANDYESVGATQSATLFHDLGNLRSMSYSTGVQGDNDPLWWVDGYFMNVSYRQAIYKKWMYASVSPEVTFPRDRDFNATWGIQLRIEGFLGKRYR